MKILFITELYPEARRGGEFIRNYGLYKLLETCGHEVFSILGKSHYGAENKMPASDKYQLFDFGIHYKSDSQLTDARLKFKQQPELIQFLDKVVADFKPDIVFWDYYYYGQYIKYFKTKGIPVIYGTHNVQSRLTLQLPSTNLKGNLMRQILYRFYKRHENKYLKNADAIIAVSNNDLEFYKRKFPSVKSYLIPNFLIEDDYNVPAKERENYIIMTGNFYAYQNAEGLKWFLENVWDDELASKSKLVIAGRASDEVHTEIMKNKTYKSFEAVGSVDDMKPYITGAKLSIVPLLHGSGTRLKCIESMALKTQLVSTSQGAEGIAHKGSIAIANKPEEFKKIIIDIMDGKLDSTQDAYNIFLSEYSLKANIIKFNSILNELVSA